MRQTGSTIDLLRQFFETYEQDTNEPEHEAICDLFRMYSEAQKSLAIEPYGSKAFDNSVDQISLSGIKSHRLYSALKDKGIIVEYYETLLNNRKIECGKGPDKLEFHLHQHCVEAILCFCILGTSDPAKLEIIRRSYGSAKGT
jgi:hypothetical protein